MVKLFNTVLQYFSSELICTYISKSVFSLTLSYNINLGNFNIILCYVNF